MARQTLSGKISYFGGPTDPESGSTTASGAPVSEPGIAVYNRSTLGGYWRVKLPNGKVAVIKQTDIGPAPWTGRKIDFTASSLKKLGYTTSNFPTDATASAEFLGKSPTGGATGLSITGGTLAKEVVDKLILSAGQKKAIAGLTGKATATGTTVNAYKSAVTDMASAFERRQAKEALVPRNLTTEAGVHRAISESKEVVSNKKAEQELYKAELHALQNEAKAWAKSRDFYSKLARKKHGKAKKEALETAATYKAKIEQAQLDAHELQGTIYSQETAIKEAENAEAAIPAEAAAAQAEAATRPQKELEEGQSANLAGYQGEVSKVDAEVRAHLMTEDQGKAAKIGIAQRAVRAGETGALSAEGLLQVKGDLVEFSEAVTNATTALENHVKVQEEATKTLKEFVEIGTALEGVENTTLVKAMADLISAQIGGRPQAYGAGRGAMSGAAARY